MDTGYLIVGTAGWVWLLGLVFSERCMRRIGRWTVIVIVIAIMALAVEVAV